MSLPKILISATYCQVELRKFCKFKINYKQGIITYIQTSGVQVYEEPNKIWIFILN